MVALITHATVVDGTSQELCSLRLGLGSARKSSAAVCSGPEKA